MGGELKKFRGGKGVDVLVSLTDIFHDPDGSKVIEHARDLRRRPFAISPRRLDALRVQSICNGAQCCSTSLLQRFDRRRDIGSPFGRDWAVPELTPSTGINPNSGY
jgi:hypothetical protein